VEEAIRETNKRNKTNQFEDETQVVLEEEMRFETNEIEVV
jgi:hypothetical protein